MNIRKLYEFFSAHKIRLYEYDFNKRKNDQAANISKKKGFFHCLFSIIFQMETEISYSNDFYLKIIFYS